MSSTYFINELIQALGERYDNHENLSAVYVTYAAMTNGAEMHRRVDETAYAAAGYTPERLITAAVTCMIHLIFCGFACQHNFTDCVLAFPFCSAFYSIPKLI